MFIARERVRTGVKKRAKGPRTGLGGRGCAFRKHFARIARFARKRQYYDDPKPHVNPKAETLALNPKPMFTGPPSQDWLYRLHTSPEGPCAQNSIYVGLNVEPI